MVDLTWKSLIVRWFALLDDSPSLGLNLTCEHVKLPRYETSHFLLSKTQSLSLLCRVVAGGIPTSIPSLSSTETWHLIIPPVFSCLEKKQEKSHGNRQTKTATDIAFRSRLLQAPQRQHRCRAFWWWTWRGSYPPGCWPPGMELPINF